jgi:hypothetical protein
MMMEAEAIVLVLLHWRSRMREREKRKKEKGCRLRGNLEGIMKKKLEKWVAERYIGNCSVAERALETGKGLLLVCGGVEGLSLRKRH